LEPRRATTRQWQLDRSSAYRNDRLLHADGHEAYDFGRIAAATPCQMFRDGANQSSHSPFSQPIGKVPPAVVR
jgi:hypothetical protein